MKFGNNKNRQHRKNIIGDTECQETGVQEPIVKEENTKDSFKDKDYTIDELMIC